MKDLYPEFANEVDFYAIGPSPFEDLELLESERIKQNYPWPVAEIDFKVLKDLRVLQQSTKIAVDHHGVITYRAGFGTGGPSRWREVFVDLVDRSWN